MLSPYEANPYFAELDAANAKRYAMKPRGMAGLPNVKIDVLGKVYIDRDERPSNPRLDALHEELNDF